MDEVFDTIEDHKLGFLIALNCESDEIEVQKIDDPEGFAEEMGYDFKIPKLGSDVVAKKLAKVNGYLFNDKENRYKVTGKVNL